MILSRNTLKEIGNQDIVPKESLLSLPEKVLQFGTGVLLRGLPDYFIDEANKKGVFNGRIVVVKSTGAGSSSPFDEQDGLFTHVIRGIEDGRKVDQVSINSSVSRVLSAASDWDAILACAASSEMKIVISNTTEVGIQLDSEDKIGSKPPRSFPGKLLAFLHERYKAFGGSEESGLVIVPTELIVDNGKKLKGIVLELAALNQLDSSFISWVAEHNRFCDSLVDRIVPGKPDAGVVEEISRNLGYEDQLMIVSEVYSLWAIEGDKKVEETLSFAAVNSGVVIAPDIEIFRELKLRLLNGTHTLSCGIAFLSGFQTVKKAMDDQAMAGFISSIMKEEIAPAIPYDVSDAAASEFAGKVIDRFANPHIEHLWLAITAQFSAKLKMRVLPVLLNHYKNTSTAPDLIAFGFAAYILFMKAVRSEGGQYYGELSGQSYLITDDKAPVLFEKWQKGAGTVVHEVLSSAELWGTDLSTLPGFEEAVSAKFEQLISEGALAVLKAAGPVKA